MGQQQISDVVKREPPKAKMTYEEFLNWCDEDTLAEWVDGEIIMVLPASVHHQRLADFLVKCLGIYVEQRDLGVVLSAPFQMKLEHGREPDLLFIAKEHLDRLRDNYLDGPADLVVEIVSPESAARDRGEKFYEYEAGGVGEYWLIDPLRQRAEFYQLEEGRYTLVQPDAGGVYHSAVVRGFWLRVTWLWQDPLPPTLDVLRELGII
jgi:Uma2 family endonuclease